MAFEGLLDQLIGSTMYHKEEDKIKPREYKELFRDFSSLKTFWGKALYLVYLRQYKDNSKKAIANKIIRDLKVRDGQVYKRHIEHFIKDLNRQSFTNPPAIMDSLIDHLAEYGEQEFTILARIIYHLGNEWVVMSKKVLISKDSIEIIKKPL